MQNCGKSKAATHFEDPQVSSPRRRWLIIAHSFNVDGRAASLTITDKIPALISAGIEPVVISAATGYRDTRFPHYQLLPWGPSGLRFDFRHIMQRRFGRGALYRVSTLLVSILLAPLIIVERACFGLSNQASWVIPAFIAGRSAAKKYKVELIYSTGGAASAHHAAALIKRRLGIPWIAEIHDPMVLRDNESDDGSSPRGTRNARYLQRMERRICTEADCVWWFTGDALNYARARNPSLGDKGFVVLPGANPPGVDVVYVPGETLNLCHFGAITEDRSLAPLLAAIDDLVLQTPGLRDRLRLHIYGSELDSNSKAVLGDTGLNDVVVLHTRVPRIEAFSEMQRADALLLLHGDYEGCAEYIPSKLYDYFQARRPVFALTNRNAFLDRLLADHGSYICHTLDAASIRDALLQLFGDWAGGKLERQTAKPISVEDAVGEILEKTETCLKGRAALRPPDGR